MTILLNKPYLVKVTMKGEGGRVKNTQKVDLVVYGLSLEHFIVINFVNCHQLTIFFIKV